MEYQRARIEALEREVRYLLLFKEYVDQHNKRMSARADRFANLNL